MSSPTSPTHKQTLTDNCYIYTTTSDLWYNTDLLLYTDQSITMYHNLAYITSF